MDDPELLMQFTALFLQRQFNVKGSMAAVEVSMLQIKNLLSMDKTSSAGLMVELTYYFLRSFTRHRPQTSLEPLEAEIRAFQEHWTAHFNKQEDNYHSTLLQSLQQFYFKIWH
jgi:hypothetical protein